MAAGILRAVASDRTDGASTAARRIAVAAAVNEPDVLDQCLAASPDIASGNLPLRTYQGYRSASVAYNRALEETDAEILILAHQDVYLPAGTLARLDAELRRLDELAPDWAVAGAAGADAEKVFYGAVWSSGIGGLVAGNGGLPARVETLDEMILIVRVDAGLRFDDNLPGFHLYGTDIIQIAASQGRSAWVVDLPAVHHSRPVRNLNGSYRQAWHYMRRKWRDRLPIRNLVCDLTASPWTLWEKSLRIRIKHRGRSHRDQPSSDPAAIARRMGFEA
jgi:hypothetical protein